ncbi:MAG: hypothetical protein ABI658_04375 [Acidimicrobiales bacterium]
MGAADYLIALRSRWWAIAALVLIGSSVAFISTPSKVPTASADTRFRATTVLVKGPSSIGGAADATNLALVSSLVWSSAVIERSAAELGRSASDLTTDLESSVNDKAGTLQISSVDTDPARATKEADTLAAQLVTFLVERRQQQLDPLIDATNERIATFENRIRALDSLIPPPGSQADLQRAERDSLVRQLSANYDQLQQLAMQAASAANELAVLSPAAALPDSASGGFSVPDSRGARAAIGAIVGFLAGLALIVAFERINPKVRTIAQAEDAFGLPVVAEIPRQSRRSRWRGRITTFSEPHSIAAESYRGLRTALLHMPRANGADPEVADRFAGGHVVLVTSGSPGEGKTTVTANIAAAFAEKDGDVVVVSGDARQPAIEAMLLGRRAAGAKLTSKNAFDAVPTMIPRVKLVLSCDPDANPADIVGYERGIAQHARSLSQTVILDTPPALIANDATELMHAADSVVLVARCGSTTFASARRMAGLLAQRQVVVLGVVLVGAGAAGGADSSYYRARPRRRERREMPRPASAIAAIGWRAPDPTSPPRISRSGPSETPAAEPVAPPVTEPAVPVAPADDGGIWRRKTVIDLSGGEQYPLAQSQSQPLPAPARHAERFESKEPPQADGDGRRGNLPLFRTGDGKGRSR